MTKEDFSMDWQGEEPPVDQELRQMMQTASAEPTAAEMASFWQDLEGKLDGVAPAEHKARWFALPRVYMPWLGAASGLLVVLMLLVPQRFFETGRSASLEQDTQGFSESLQDQETAPMVLGAAPEVQSPTKAEQPASARREAMPKKQKLILHEQAPPFIPLAADFPVRWERLSAHEFVLRFAPTHQAAFLKWSKAWPENITVTPENGVEEAADRERVYRVEQKP